MPCFVPLQMCADVFMSCCNIVWVFFFLVLQSCEVMAAASVNRRGSAQTAEKSQLILKGNATTIPPTHFVCDCLLFEPVPVCTSVFRLHKQRTLCKYLYFFFPDHTEAYTCSGQRFILWIHVCLFILCGLTYEGFVCHGSKLT